MFNSYTSNNKEPGGNHSKIYVVINKDVLKGKSNEVYQFHFETTQYKDRTNGSNINLYQFFNQNPKLGEFFKNILNDLAKKSGGDLKNNKYIKILMEMGEVDNIFDYIDNNAEEISLDGMKIPKLPNILGQFKNVEKLDLIGCGLVELPPSIGEMSNLQMLLLANNNLTKLPDTIGKLKNLSILNLIGNKIEKFPESIKELSSEHGGNLFRISVSLDLVPQEEVKRLRTLLPDVAINGK
jgi:Leucine-rich repeat (LRR) protein